MAEWFPRLFLGAVFGREGLDVNGLALGAARFSNVAALLAMPIFNAGRTQAINDIAESAQREAVLRYEDAIVRALEDVENALVALDDERHRAQLMQSAAASADAALGHAQSLYDRGQTDFLPLLDAQRVRLVVRVSANEAQHATAARQRATVQGARRRLGSVRARYRRTRRERRAFAQFVKR